jgi:hypothetical protein
MKNILLLVGSPRKEKSTSNSLGEYLLNKFGNEDFNTKKVFLHYKKQMKEQEILDNIDWADLIILSFPLYVDCLPADVIKNLEMIKEKYGSTQNKEFFAISNCGFPESYHNDTALKICNQFAIEMSWEWKGSLAVGMGAAINGTQLIEPKGMVKNIVQELDNVYDKLIHTSDSIIASAEPSIPKWLYIVMGNMGWRYQAFKNGVWNELKDKPYKKEK